MRTQPARDDVTKFRLTGVVAIGLGLTNAYMWSQVTVRGPYFSLVLAAAALATIVGLVAALRPNRYTYWSANGASVVLIACAGLNFANTHAA